MAKAAQAAQTGKRRLRGAAVRRCDDPAMVRWCDGAMVRWCDGAMVRWCYGAMVRWCDGARERRGAGDGPGSARPNFSRRIGKQHLGASRQMQRGCYSAAGSARVDSGVSDPEGEFSIRGRRNLAPSDLQNRDIVEYPAPIIVGRRSQRGLDGRNQTRSRSRSRWSGAGTETGTGTATILARRDNSRN